MLTGEVPFKAESQVAVAMKHVKEPLPDVQRLRPGGVGLARRGARARHGQGDRRTATPRPPRWCTTSRRCWRSRSRASGETSGEATTRAARPARRHRRLRARAAAQPAPVDPVRARGAAAGRRRGRRTSPPARRRARAAATPRARPASPRVDLARSAANDYDPEGDEQRVRRRDPERDRRQPVHRVGHRALQRRPRRASARSGVGLYVDAGSPIAGKALEPDHVHARASPPRSTAPTTCPRTSRAGRRLSR